MLFVMACSGAFAATTTKKLVYNFSETALWTDVFGNAVQTYTDYDYLYFGGPSKHQLVRFDQPANLTSSTTRRFTSDGFRVARKVWINIACIPNCTVTKLIINFFSDTATNVHFYLDGQSAKEDALNGTSTSLTGMKGYEDMSFYFADVVVIKNITIEYHYNEDVRPTQTMNEYGVATCFYRFDCHLPEGYDAYLASLDDTEENTVVLSKAYPAGSVIPAYTPLIIKGPENTTYDLYADVATQPSPANNILRCNILSGYMPPIDAVDNYYYYKLAMGDDGHLGFYWGAENGGRFEIGACRAFIAMPKPAVNNAKPLTMVFDDQPDAVRGIREQKTADTRIYDLTGRRITKPGKGVYIRGGKKYVK